MTRSRDCHGAGHSPCGVLSLLLFHSGPAKQQPHRARGFGLAARSLPKCQVWPAEAGEGEGFWASVLSSVTSSWAPGPGGRTLFWCTLPRLAWAFPDPSCSQRGQEVTVGLGSSTEGDHMGPRFHEVWCGRENEGALRVMGPSGSASRLRWTRM